MAAFNLIGVIENVKYLSDSCILYVTEFKNGYRTKDGEVVDGKCVQWRVLFKSYFKKYLSEHFNRGMLVEVKGDILPYAIEHGEMTDGYSIIGQTCNLAAYPRYAAKLEKKIIKESQETSEEKPDLEGFRQKDF